MSDELLTSKPYSPVAATDGTTAVDADEIFIDPSVGEGIGSFPVPESGELGVAVLSKDDRFESDDPGDYETVTYSGADTDNNKLTGVVRGVEGQADEWESGTKIAVMMTAEHVKRLNSKLRTHLSEEVSQDEVHGIRATEGDFEFYDGTDWVKISSIGNLDGGKPDTNYGGITSIDAGGVV